MVSEPNLVVAELAGILDDLGIPYVVGGSLASSMYGVPRATQDVDLVADIPPARVEALAARLADHFHVRIEEVEGPAGRVAIRFATREDTLLHKLVWYRLGGETSERQWGDIRGILEVQADGLDVDHLDRWATELGVADLLARLRQA